MHAIPVWIMKWFPKVLRYTYLLKEKLGVKPEKTRRHNRSIFHRRYVYTTHSNLMLNKSAGNVII